ncbi:hypothetical protein GCM10027037_26760 [Mucilaginibacter koreensis]
MQIPVITTKASFKKMINETIEETENLKNKFPEISMYNTLFLQLIALRSLLVEQKLIVSKTDIDEQFTIGAIATKNFDYEHDLYAQKLVRIFGAALRYNELQA